MSDGRLHTLPLSPFQLADSTMIGLLRLRISFLCCTMYTALQYVHGCCNDHAP